MASYLTTSDAAGELGVSTIRVRQLCQQGRLKATLIVGRWAIRPADLDRFAKIPRPPGRPATS